MKKIRDLIHDGNDILLAILVIVMAAGVIFWRMTDILAYPDKVAAQNQAEAVQEEPQPEEDADEADEGAEEDAEDSENADEEPKG